MGDWVFKDRLKFGSPQSNVGIVTFWGSVDKIKVSRNLYFVMGNLYTTFGLNFVARNLLANPYIDTLLLLSHEKYTKNNDYSEFRNKNWPISIDNLSNHLDKLKDIKIIEFDKQLNSDHNIGECEKLLKSLQNNHDVERLPIYIDISFVSHNTRKPSELSGFRITGNSISQIWHRGLRKILDFGNLKSSKYGNCIEILNMISVIYPADLPCMSHDDNRIDNFLAKISAEKIMEFEKYYQNFISEESQDDVKYTYMTRMIKYDQIQRCVEHLKSNITSRQGIITLWDAQTDIGNESPCMINIQLNIRDDIIVDMTVYFRSHDIFAAYPSNLYMLRKMHTTITQQIDPRFHIGVLTIISSSAHIYEYNIEEAIQITQNIQLFCNFDGRGNASVQKQYSDIIKKDIFIVYHLGPDGRVIKEYSNPDRQKLLDEMLQDDCLLEPGNWCWLTKTLYQL
jgi:thymidylate synthase